VSLRAKQDGHVQSVKAEVDALRMRARFFVSARLQKKVLEIAGE